MSEPTTIHRSGNYYKGPSDWLYLLTTIPRYDGTGRPLMALINISKGGWWRPPAEVVDTEHLTAHEWFALSGISGTTTDVPLVRVDVQFEGVRNV